MRIGFIGAGNMVSAIVRGAVAAGTPAGHLLLTSKHGSAERLAEQVGAVHVPDAAAAPRLSGVARLHAPTPTSSRSQPENRARTPFHKVNNRGHKHVTPHHDVPSDNCLTTRPAPQWTGAQPAHDTRLDYVVRLS